MKKLSALLLSFILLLSGLPVFAQGDELVPLMGFEVEDNHRSWPDNLFFIRRQEQTGLKFSYRQYGRMEDYEKALLALPSLGEEMPQVLFKAALNPITALDLFKQGVLVDLAPHLQEHAPNLYQLMEENPDIRRAITLEGGVIPALPYISLTKGQNILWINTTWLLELKLEMPTTMEELQSVLLAFKEKDPNRNGRADEIPLSFLGAYDLKYLAHAFGLIANDFNVFVKEGAVQFLPEQPLFYDFLVKVKELYQSGLLDKEGFTSIDSLRRVTDAKTQNRYGAFFAPLPTRLVPLEWTAQYQAMMPLTFEGEAIYRAVASPVNYGTFAITTAAKDIPALLSWVDYLYTYEGATLANIGQINEDYVVDGDGTWRLTRETADSLSIARVVIATDQSVPGVSNEDFQLRYSDKTVRDLTAQTLAFAKASSLAFPDIPFTREDVDKLSPLQSVLGRKVDEGIGRFVTGEKELSPEQFQLFLSELKENGSDQLKAIFQDIYERGMK